MARRKERVILAASSATLALALIFSFSFLIIKAFRNQATADTAQNPATLLAVKDAPLPEQAVSPVELSTTFRKIARAVKPAVVNISTVQKVKGGAMSGFPQIPGFQFDFPGAPQQPFKQRGTGSGVIVTTDGYVVTNNHVVGKADEIEVKLSDGRKFKGKVVGKDELTDIAVVKIEGNNLPTANLGDSDVMEQGDWVVAIGSPFGLEQTITAGIISAKGRHVGRSQYNNFIQTDASINPGNSGGPLVNMSGQVVGINTMIFSESGGNQGIGFAVPSNLVRSVYDQLVSRGKVVRGYLGVTIGEVTPEQVKNLNLTVSEGAFVNDVQSDSPAARAGIQSGDVIVGFDGKPIKDHHQLTSLVAETPVGRQAEIKFIRDGKPQTTRVTIVERDRRVDQIGENPFEEEGNSPESESAGKLGLSASNLSEDQTANLRIKNGAVIDQIVPGGPAAEAGLQRGDIIHKVNTQPIRSVSDLSAVLKTLKSGDSITLQVERSGRLFFATLTIE
ncbi:MAG: DegQ family serine endoprotease [Acidobacteriota bacterium]